MTPAATSVVVHCANVVSLPVITKLRPDKVIRLQEDFAIIRLLARVRIIQTLNTYQPITTTSILILIQMGQQQLWRQEGIIAVGALQSIKIKQIAETNP